MIYSQNILVRLGLILVTLFPALSVHSRLTLPEIIDDNMVLQCELSIPIWGIADPFELVTVHFNGQEAAAHADSSGVWKINLGPYRSSSKPQSMKVMTDESITINNILIGEVWLCAGQSNMQWTVEKSYGGTAAIDTADYPEIRLFNVSRDVAFGRKEGDFGNWEECDSESVRHFSGVGYFFGMELYNKLGVPVGLINSSYGGSQAEAWTPREYLAASPDLAPCIAREKQWEAERAAVRRSFDEEIKKWEKACNQATRAGEKAPRKPRVPDALRDYRIAGSIYDNMIAPLIPFAIKGALWYQGESNEARAEQYELLLPVMIKSWRERWDRPYLNFGIVQLPNFRSTSEIPTDEAWSRIRDAQRKTHMNTSQTGLIVTIDVGEASDIHPGNKLTVGKRLYKWALSKVYFLTNSGLSPLYRNVEFQDGKAIVFFDNVSNGLKTCDSKSPGEFVIAGADQKWHWAQAKITGDNRVTVWSEEVPKPVAVRYAFNNNPKNPNLSNSTCIPASPFRTDNWPGPTTGKR